MESEKCKLEHENTTLPAIGNWKRKLETGNWTVKTGSWKLETGHWNLEFGICKLQSGTCKLATGN